MPVFDCPARQLRYTEEVVTASRPTRNRHPGQPASGDPAVTFLPHNGRLAANLIDPTRTRLVQELRHNSPLLGCRR